MSIAAEIICGLPTGTIDTVSVNKAAELHGQKAIEVTVTTTTGKSVVGTFTKEHVASFGGIEFDTNKNIGELMIAKVKAVLRGTADATV